MAVATADPEVQIEVKTSKHRRDIEGLRAVAVLLVICDHLFGWPHGGYVGVDVFFVISGFLITGLLLREHDGSGRISFAGFYRRRARRILPAATLTLVATCAATYLVLVGSRIHQTYVDALWSAVFWSNWHFAAVGTDYFQSNNATSPVQHFWSLSLEEQFYVVWPALLLLMLSLGARRWGRRVSHRGAIGALTVIIVASAWWSIVQTRSNPTVAYFSTFTRAWELGVGALLAIAASGASRLPFVARAIGAWVGLAGIIVSSFVINGSTPFPGSAAMLPVAAVALVIFCGIGATDHSYIPALTNPVSGYIGRISYSLYLWHFPAIVLVGAVIAPSTARFYLLAGGIGVLCAVLSFHLVEDPIRRRAWRTKRTAGDRSPRTGFSIAWFGYYQYLTLGLIVLVCVFFGLVLRDNQSSSSDATASQGVSGSGATTRQASPGSGKVVPLTAQAALTAEIKASISPSAWGKLNPSLDQLTSSRVPEWSHSGCDVTTASNEDKCIFGSPNATKSAVVEGDSTALSWVPAIRAALGPSWRVHVLTLNSCPAALVKTFRDPDKSTQLNTTCLDHKAWVQTQIQALKPDMVFMSSAKRFVDRQYARPQGNAKLASWEQGMRQAIAAVKPYAKRVVVLSSPPTTGDLTSCVTRFSKPVDCTRDVGSGWQTVSVVEAAAAKDEGEQYIDTSSWNCALGRCPAVIGTTPVMVDGTHFTGAYSKSLGTVMRLAVRP